MQTNIFSKTLLVVMIVVFPAFSALANAADPEEVNGFWVTAENDAVIRFAPCAENVAAMCGVIVWDKDANTPASTCHLRIAQFARYDKDAWREGWVYDPRDQKRYQGVARVKADELRIRAFVGAEILGVTEQFRRVTALPRTPVCKP